MLSESQVGKVTIHNNDMKIPTRTYTYILAFTSLKVKLIKGRFTIDIGIIKTAKLPADMVTKKDWASCPSPCHALIKLVLGAQLRARFPFLR